jgi:DNA-directed RNA polymerase omega subunit
MKVLTSSRGTQLNNEQCVANVENRFDLVLIASARARELMRRHKADENPNQLNAMVSALLDVQSGLVGREYLKKVR